MDPQFLGPEHWNHVAGIQVSLILFVVMMANGTVAFLVAHAVIPSLVATADLSGEVRALRTVLYPVAAVSLAFMLYALGRTIYLSVVLLQQYYGRFAI